VERTASKDAHRSHRSTREGDNGGRNGSLGSNSLQVPTDTLVDLSYDSGDGDQSDRLFERTAAMAKVFYPHGYSDSAVAEAIDRHTASGQVYIIIILMTWSNLIILVQDKQKYHK